MLDRSEPRSVYEPIRYVLAAGGKRLRSVLVTLSCEGVGGRRTDALHAASAIELLHNFTLVHDDIMDHAELRRGKKTVHERWDTNTAILAGDEMVAIAYRTILKTRSNALTGVLQAFTDAFVEVCEGQGMDKEFELRDDVTVKDYFRMIRKKTARVISAAAEIGALIGKGSAARVKALRSFGEHLGIAFQLRDDLLDIVGDREEIGKTIGGDVVERKKTFLLLSALERATGVNREFLRELGSVPTVTPMTIGRVRAIYESTCSLSEAHREIEGHTRAAQRALTALPPSMGKETLSWLAEELAARTN